MTPDRKTERKISRELQVEARWLQKTLFALRKAMEAQAKLAETTGEPTAPLTTSSGGEVTLATLEEALTARVDEVRASITSLRPGGL